ncbi:uncharacterized protein LY89DRAFT_736607 [Mollisia scopiformis]|uniref:Transmembrane protein n=1 Tax=Mollisia scopiformis TaxID=149040 RepID=A0A194X3H4_MOLSC|nr:uncharacterized protein LY89DRAFT_736607 [Mollisia scopiformis]KUJ14579.1 hypothetical protein LY89DRAFT_736607 [Mollisia scopiformis]
MYSKSPRKSTNKRRPSKRVHIEVNYTYSQGPTPLLEQPFSRSNTLATSIIVALFVILLLVIFTPRAKADPPTPIDIRKSHSPIDPWHSSASTTATSLLRPTKQLSNTYQDP